MTIARLTESGISCYRIRMEDPSNIVSVHLHTFNGADPRVKWLKVESRQLGLLIEEGVESVEDCE